MSLMVARHVHSCFQARKRLTQSDEPHLVPYLELYSTEWNEMLMCAGAGGDSQIPGEWCQGRGTTQRC